MDIFDTAEKRIELPSGCAYCQKTSGGQHAFNCPMAATPVVPSPVIVTLPFLVAVSKGVKWN